jgi:4-aminobutyrate aminotransferase
MAKAIGGGLPLGVTLTRDELMRWHVGAHASTFGGNPVAIAASLKTIEILEGGVLDNCREVGKYMVDLLKETQNKYDCVVDLRGLGLMIGVEFAKDTEIYEPWPALRDNIVEECFKRGLVIQGAGESAIRFSPPLIVDRDQVRFAVETLEAAIEASLG